MSDKKMKKGMFEDMEDERAIDVNFGEKDSIEDEDEEEKIWEEEQFRKGIGVWVAIAASVVHSVQKQQQPKFVYPAVMSVGLDAMMSILQQAEIARKSLQENLKRLQESHDRTMWSLRKVLMKIYRSTSYTNIAALGKFLSNANEKFIFT